MDDTTTVRLEDEIGRLRRRTRRLELLLGAVVTAVLVSAAAPRAPASEVLRARGLVLEDAEGRARLLLGTPVPAVDERLQKDVANGVLLLDEQGRDRLQLGHVGGEAALRLHDVAGQARASLSVGAEGARLRSFDADGRAVAELLGGAR